MNELIFKILTLVKTFSEKCGKVFNIGLIREKAQTIYKKISSVFGFSKKKLNGFLVVSLNQATVEIVYAQSFLEGIQILAYDVYKLFPGSQDGETIIDYFIADFLRKNSITEQKVILNISDKDAIVVHCLTLPELPAGEILDAAKWKLKEEVSFDLENAPIGWQTARKYEDEDGSKHIDLIFAVAEIKAIYRYLSCVINCSLQPIRITTGLLNYTNILNRLPELPEVSAVLDIDYTATTLSIYSGGKLLFVRSIPVSWEMFSQALTRLIVSDKGKIEISIAEAEVIRNTYGIPQDESQVIKGNIRGIHIMSLLRPLLEALVRELKLSFNYFAMNFDMEKPAVLFTAGGGAELKNLESYLYKELHIEVSRLPLPGCVYLNKLKGENSKQENIQKIVNTIGVALGDSQGINLLPKEVKTQKTEFLQRVSLRVGGVAVAAIFLVLLFFSKAQVRDYQNRLKAVQAHLEVIGGVKNLREKLLKREELIAKIQKKKIPANGILKVMGVITPNKVILDQLVFNQANYHLVLKGTVSSSDETAGAVLSSFMKQLESSPFFTEASLISSHGAEGAKVFEIKCNFPEQ